MAKTNPAAGVAAFPGRALHCLWSQRRSRAMIDVLEPRRLLAPWIATEVAGQVGGGGGSDVEVAGGRAYVLMGGLTILDVSTTPTPVQLGRVDIPSYTHSVTVSGSYAYLWGESLSVSEADLWVVDISNPAAPAVVGTCKLLGAQATDGCVVGSYAYLTDTSGLDVMNVSDPFNPALITSLAISSGATGMTVAGTYAYVVGGQRLSIVNIADPSNPVKVGEFSGLRGAAHEVVVSGSTAYVVGDRGLNIVDVSNPSAPVGINWFGAVGAANDLRCSDSKLYIVSGNSGILQVVDVSDPSAPVVISYLTNLLDTGGYAITLSGSTAYVCADGLEIVNVADPYNPVKTGIYTPGDARCIAFSGTSAYTNDYSFPRLHVINMQDFDAPTWTDARTTNAAVNDIAIAGSYLYATEGSAGLEVFDISTPSNLIRVGAYDTRGQVYADRLRGIAISGSYAYIAGDLNPGKPDSGSLQVFNITNPSAPILVGSYAIPDGAWDVAVSGTLAYVDAHFFGVRIIDISDPAHMVQLSSVAASYTENPVILADSRVYLGQSIIDVSNPAAPVLLNSGVPGYFRAVSGNLAYTDREILDVSDPAAIVQVGSYKRPIPDVTPVSDVALYGSSALFAGDYVETIRFNVGENEPATDISLTQTSIAENSPTGTVVGTLSSTCLNPSNTFTYALFPGTGAADNFSFTISGNQLRANAYFNYEAKSSYSIRIRSTDAVGQWFEKAFTINVTDVNESPTNISLSASSIAENQPVGTVVGTLSSSDPDAGNTFSYSLVSGTGSTDNASFTISGNQLLAAASFRYQTKNSYSIRVRTTDQGGLYTEKTFTVSVTADTTAPTVTAVYVRGSTWNTNYLSFLAANISGSNSTYGYAIPVGSGAAQLQTLPWRNLNQISIAFSEGVSIAQGQFAIVGSVGSYSVSGFSYNSTDHVATWTLSAAIGPDKLYVAVPGSGTTPVQDAAGNSLDGEWNNPSSYSQAGSTSSFPSGNGVAGGDFAFRFDVLPGDSTGGSLGKVNVADVAQTKSRSSLPVTLSSYRSDVDGNNLVNVADVAYVKSKSSIYSLPVNPPVLPLFSSAFSQVSLLQYHRRTY